MFEEELLESDSSDEDFVPDGEKSEVSEEDSDGAEAEDQDGEGENVTEKKKQIKSSKANRRKKKKEIKDEVQILEEKEQTKEEETPEERKKKADAIWADFLKDCGPVVKKKPVEPRTSSSEKVTTIDNSSESSSNVESTSDRLHQDSASVCSSQKTEGNTTNEQSEPVVEVYEFAGEKVVVQKKPDPRKRPISRGGGAAAILSQLNKKTKLSTLEKSKLDWESFKSDEGIGEQLSAHNRGKNGYLEKQDFLERADLRQFEIEKQMRAYNRSKRV